MATYGEHNALYKILRPQHYIVIILYSPHTHARTHARTHAHTHTHTHTGAQKKYKEE